MIKEVKAKRILSHSTEPDSWFGIKYNMNLYRGCQHQCIYCDARSECYQIENFNDIEVKVNAIELLQKEIMSKRIKGTIGTGAMSDPYLPLEKKYNLTRQALKVIRDSSFPIHIITKGSLVVRDKDLLKDINRIYAAVSFTVTTTDDDLAKKIEPGAPSPTERLKAMKELSDTGIYTGITMMPILPFIEDSDKNILDIVEKAKAHGASYIIPWFGMTLRDRQKAHFFEKLDKYFPNLKYKYQQKFGNNYQCNANNSRKLWKLFKTKCEEYNISVEITKFDDRQTEQLSFLKP